jgi:hypothetical protein
VGYEGRGDDTKIEIDDENVHIGRKFRCGYGVGCRAKEPP